MWAPKTKEFAADPPSPAGELAGRRGLDPRASRHSYGELAAIERLDLEAPAHGVLGLVGPSGCGKSTLLELIAGLQQPSGGRDRGRREQRRRPSASPAAPSCRSATCCCPGCRRSTTPRWRCATAASGAARRASEAGLLFERFGLAGFERTRPAELSGGMRQRVAFLRTLVAGKPVLALDEPFASLDAITRAEMQDWLAEALAADPRTVVLVTHDVEEALYLCRPRRRALGAAGARGRGAERAGAAGARPRRRGHRPRVRRRARARDGRPAGRGARSEGAGPCRWPPCCSRR